MDDTQTLHHTDALDPLEPKGHTDQEMLARNNPPDPIFVAGHTTDPEPGIDQKFGPGHSEANHPDAKPDPVFIDDRKIRYDERLKIADELRKQGYSLAADNITVVDHQKIRSDERTRVAQELLRNGHQVAAKLITK